MTATLTRIGDYTLGREVSVTASVVRYEATHVVLPRRAVVEVLTTVARPMAVQMMREACILEALRHAGVPRVFECGVLPDRRPWVAIERIAGVSLEAELRRECLPAGQVVTLLEQLAEILAYAHARGVLHRDVAPGAIFRGETERGFPLCLHSWGYARTLDTELPPAPRGSAHYRAPEVLRGEEIDGRADVFALGMVAYEALSGSLPSLPLMPATSPRSGPLAALIEQMLSADLFQRPTAIEVYDTARAIHKQVKASAETTEATLDPVEEVVLLVDVSREPIRNKPRWTPPWALNERAAAAQEIVTPPRRNRDRD